MKPPWGSETRSEYPGVGSGGTFRGSFIYSPTLSPGWGFGGSGEQVAHLCPWVLVCMGDSQITG